MGEKAVTPLMISGAGKLPLRESTEAGLTEYFINLNDAEGNNYMTVFAVKGNYERSADNFMRRIYAAKIYATKEAMEEDGRKGHIEIRDGQGNTGDTGAVGAGEIDDLSRQHG